MERVDKAEHCWEGQNKMLFGSHEDRVGKNPRPQLITPGFSIKADRKRRELTDEKNIDREIYGYEE